MVILILNNLINSGKASRKERRFEQTSCVVVTSLFSNVVFASLASSSTISLFKPYISTSGNKKFGTKKFLARGLQA